MNKNAMWTFELIHFTKGIWAKRYIFYLSHEKLTNLRNILETPLNKVNLFRSEIRKSVPWLTTNNNINMNNTKP